MSPSRRCLALVVLASVLCAVLSNTPFREQLDNHSFKSPLFRGRDHPIHNWIFGGSAIAQDQFVRLTPAISDRSGYLWNTAPIATLGWEVTFEFSVRGTRSGQGSDGMAFWYVEDPLSNEEMMKTETTLFGYQEHFKGLGVLFDSMDNDNKGDNPWINGMINDGTRSFDWDGDGRASSWGGCRVDYRNRLYPVSAKVTYEHNTVTVYVDLEHSGKFHRCFEIKGAYLKPNGYFGFTAKTGQYPDNHDLFAVTVYNLDERFAKKEVPVESPPPPLKPEEKPHGHDLIREKTHHDTPHHENIHGNVHENVHENIHGNPSSHHAVHEDHDDHPPPGYKHHQPAAASSTPSSASLVSLTNDLVSVKAQLEKIVYQQGKSNHEMDTLQKDTQLRHSQVLQHMKGLASTADVVSLTAELKSLRAELRELRSILESGGTKGHDGEPLKREMALLHDSIKTASSEDQRRIGLLEKRFEEFVHHQNRAKEFEKKEAERQEKKLEEHASLISETIRSESRFGFWTYFGLLQVACLVGLFLYKRLRDQEKKHFL